MAVNSAANGLVQQKTPAGTAAMNFLRRLFSAGGPKKVDIEQRFPQRKPIGQGTMSQVYKAVDTQTGQTVALKILDKEKTLRHEQRFAGLKRPCEGEIAISMSHPNIVRTLEHGLTRNEEQFLVMEFLDAIGLASLIASRTPQFTGNLLKYCIQLGEATAYAHAQGYILRDLCPRNIVITRSNVLKLLDFGLAVPDTPEFRRPGNRTGTAMYMAPELIKRQPTDQRIDVFSYAVTCYEMYTRQFPWQSAQSLEAILQHINSPPREIRQFAPEISPAVAEIIMQGLERDPRDRTQTVKEMVQAFQAVAAQSPAARPASASRRPTS